MKSHPETETTAGTISAYQETESWARNKEEKAETFATHLSKVFKPNPREITHKEKNKLLSDDITSITLDTTTRPFIIKEVRTAIKNLNPKKAPGNDFITNKYCRRCQKRE
jgi:hypothetical protein